MVAIASLPPDLSLVIEGREAARTGRGASLRKAAGISQSELAAEIGKSAACISRWEAGERLPSFEAARAYAVALRAIHADVERLKDAQHAPSTRTGHAGNVTGSKLAGVGDGHGSV